MNKIPTAEEFLKDNLTNPKKGWSEKKRLIEFAKLHVEAALEAAANNAEITYTEEKTWDFTFVDKNSILNAYPLTNIK